MTKKKIAFIQKNEKSSNFCGIVSQLTITCSKSTIETQEKGKKYVQS